MPVNLRKSAIDKIRKMINAFSDVRTDPHETEVRRYLRKSDEALDSASTLMVRNDKAADKAGKE
jgi:hypothetical protein